MQLQSTFRASYCLLVQNHDPKRFLEKAEIKNVSICLKLWWNHNLGDNIAYDADRDFVSVAVENNWKADTVVKKDLFVAKSVFVSGRQFLYGRS